MNFAELNLSAPFLKAVNTLGYEVATPIQAQAIPIVLAGHDLIGCAHTGTGKTAAFTLPLLDRLTSIVQNSPRRPRRSEPSRPSPRPTRALILSPTRELAVQIGKSIEKYGQYSALRHCVIYGGVSQASQVKSLRHGVDVIVATPGRLLDLMAQGYVDLQSIKMLVFDEADQMLDMGFLPSLKRIVAALPTERQTLMFSATMPAAIRELAQKWMHKPAAIQAAGLEKPTERIQQTVYLIDKGRKADLLTHFLQATPQQRTLVFSRTKHGADKLVKRLKQEGLRSAAIHGDKSQGARSRALELFRGQNPPILVATDVAARGLDISGVSHVINYDLPEVPETYVHRIGRTARAGATGCAVSFCSHDERGLLRQIERFMRKPISIEAPIAGFETTEVLTDSDDLIANGDRAGGTRRPRRSAQRKFATNARNKSAASSSFSGGSRGHSRKKRSRALSQ